MCSWCVEVESHSFRKYLIISVLCTEILCFLKFSFSIFSKVPDFAFRMSSKSTVNKNHKLHSTSLT